MRRHDDMLQEVFLPIQTVSDEVSDLRELVTKDDAPAEVVPMLAANPPTQCDSQQPQEKTSTSVEEVGKEDAEVSRHGSGNENCDEEMRLGSSDFDDLDVEDRADGIWECRRSGVIKGTRLVKIKEKVKAMTM